jgi:non-homologous end joining protein Ku
MPKANPSTRSSGNVNLSFGLVNIPTTLYSGTVSDHGVKRNEFVPVEDGEDHPVGRGQVDKVTGELLERGTQIVKKIQTEYGPVYVEDHEIEELFSLMPDTLVVKEFEPQHFFHQGHFVPSGLMYVEPRKTGTGSKKGPDPVASKLIAVLFQAMKTQNAMAVCELTTRGKPKPCVLTPDGRLWLIHHTDATREQRELPEVDTNPAEVEMMGTLIKTMWAEEPLDFVDTRSALIQDFADKKAREGDFGKPEESAGREVAAAPAVPDLLAMLQASVDDAKAKQAV